MPLRNDSRRYGGIAIALHWAGAATVLAMLFTGLVMATAPGREVYVHWVKLHGAIGTVFWPLLAVRIGWHFVEPTPARLSPDRWLDRLATGVHATLLLLLAVQLVTGPLDIWSGGFPIDIFGLAAIRSPIGDMLDAIHEPLGVFHTGVGVTIAALLALHLAGVAKHVLVDRDGTLGRMLGRAKP